MFAQLKAKFQVRLDEVVSERAEKWSRYAELLQRYEDSGIYEEDIEDQEFVELGYQIDKLDAVRSRIQEAVEIIAQCERIESSGEYADPIDEISSVLTLGDECYY